MVWLVLLLCTLASGRLQAQSSTNFGPFFLHSGGANADIDTTLVSPIASGGHYAMAKSFNNLDQDLVKGGMSATVANAPSIGFHGLVRFDAQGEAMWSVAFDNAPGTDIQDILAMPNNDVVVVGSFNGTKPFPLDGALPIVATSQGTYDHFICRISFAGEIRWLKTGNHGNYSAASKAVVDADGNICVVGHGNFDNNFLEKYDGDGNLLWTRLATRPGSIRSASVDVDKSNNVYARFLDQLVKYSPQGTLLWSQTLIGSVHQVKAFSDVGAAVCGNFTSASYTIGDITLTGTQGNENAFIAKISAEGNWEWAKSLAHTGNVTFTAMDIDDDDYIYAGGNFSGTIYPGPLVSPSTNNIDGFFYRFSTAGEIDWQYQFGGIGQQSITGLRRNVHGLYYWGNLITWLEFEGTTYHIPSSSSYGGFYGRLPVPIPLLRVLESPAPVAAAVGEQVQLRVVATGPKPLTYQWIKNGVPIFGQYSNVFTIPSFTVNDVGNYSVGVIIPSTNTITVPALVSLRFAPFFTVKPESVGGAQGGSATSIATAAGNPTPVLKWRKLGGPVLHTGETFTLNGLTFADEGFYEVTATNSEGSASETLRVNVDMIPNENFFAMVHDPHRDLVYLSAGANVLRYSMASKTYLAPYVLGGNLRGLDVSADGKWLVVADHDGTTASNWVHVVNLETDQTRKVSFPRAVDESHTEFAVFGSDGRAVISSSNRLRSLNVTNDHVVVRNVSETYQIAASASRDVLALAGVENGNGSVYSYSVALTNLQPGSYNDGRTLTGVGMERRENQSVAVSRGQAIFLSSLKQPVHTLGDGITDGPLGAAYNPLVNRVYVPWMNTPEVRVYDTDTFTEITRYTTGTSPYVAGVSNRTGQAQVTRSGDLLFVTATYGVRYIKLTAQLPLIMQQPKPLTLHPDFIARFKVVASSGHALSYQWQKDEEDIPDATGPEHEELVVLNGSGRYRVRITNDAGSVYSDEVQLTALKYSPTVVWNASLNFTYGELLGAAQLNATSVAPGTFVYSPPAGTKLNAGLAQPVQLIFTPQDTAHYETITNVVLVNVAKRLLAYPVGNVSRLYGQPNSAVPFTVSGFAPGETSAVLDVPPVPITTATEASPIGTYPMTLGGGSDDNYIFAYGTGTLTITKRPVTITLSNLNHPYDGTAKSATVTFTPEEAPLTVTYAGSATPPTARGSYAVVAAVSNPNYIGTATGTLTIFKSGATIVWNPPASILYGTALGSAHYNAVASVPGIYSYTPASGTVPGAGAHTLQLIFTPLDSANYLRTTNTVALQVVTPTLVQPEQVAGSPGQFRFSFAALNGKQYAVEISDDLSHWTTLTTLTAQGGSLQVTDSAIDVTVRRFYRIVPKP